MNNINNRSMNSFTSFDILNSISYAKKDNGKGNGNTVTIEECKNSGSASGFDTATSQECENLICTHPGDNAICSQEGVTTPTPTPKPTTTTLLVIKRVVCLPADPDCSLPSLCRIDVISPSTGAAQSFDCEAAIGNGVLVTLNPGTFSAEEVIGTGAPFDTTLTVIVQVP